MFSSLGPCVSHPTSDEDLFLSTPWNQILEAVAQKVPRAWEAFEQLCVDFSYPLYSFVRRRDYLPNEAKDLVRRFFGQMVLSHPVLRGDSFQGIFRVFLRSNLMDFLENGCARTMLPANHQHQNQFSFNQEQWESRFRVEPPHDHLLERRFFERSWAFTVLRLVMRRLALEYQASDKTFLFEQLRIFLSGDQVPRVYERISTRLNLNEKQLRTEVQYLRESYGRILRQTVSRTIAEAMESDSEIRYLISVMQP